jgi:hypothetical protein
MRVYENHHLVLYILSNGKYYYAPKNSIIVTREIFEIREGSVRKYLAQYHEGMESPIGVGSSLGISSSKAFELYPPEQGPFQNKDHL